MHAHPYSFGKFKVRETCILFEFRHFLTLRTRLRISKFRLQINAKKFCSYEMSLSDCITI